MVRIPMSNFFMSTLFLSTLLLVTATTFIKSFDHQRRLRKNGTYIMQWQVERDSINFRLVVETLGYVGFGFAKRGSLNGSDLVIAGLSQWNVPYIWDCVVLENLVLRDRTQNWIIRKAIRNATHTTLEIQRNFQTRDPYDIPIMDHTMRVATFSGETDIVNQFPSVPEIQSTLTVTPLYLLNLKPNYRSSGLQTWRLTAKQTPVPDTVTTYWCHLEKMPSLPKKHHVIMMEPHYEPPENEDLIHHIVAFECFNLTQEEISRQLGKPGFDCSRPSDPIFLKCVGALFSQIGKGTQKWSLPPDVGFPIGGPENRYFLLQVHYNNVQQRKGLIDSSGFMYYYTKNLRKYDGGFMTIASTLTQMELPPGQPRFMVNAHCSQPCLSDILPDEGITILSANFHTHGLGVDARLRHFRGNVELPNIISDNTFDSNNQAFRFVRPGVKILPGDQFTVECFFNTRSRNQTVLGGLTADDEMCFSFLSYYPFVGQIYCTSAPIGGLLTGLMGVSASSSPTLNYPEYINGTQVKQWADNFDWISQEYIDAAGFVMNYGPHVTECKLNNATKSEQLATYPRYPMLP